MTGTSRGSAATSGARVEFDGGIHTLVGFSLAVALLAVLAIVIGSATSGVSVPPWVAPLGELGKFGLIAGITLVILRVENVRPAELGLSRSLLGPALLAVAGLWVAMNLLGVAVATMTGNQWGLAMLVNQPVRWPDVPAPLAVSLLFDFFVVAIVEEFVFRGYLQSKVIALLGDDSRTRIGLGILTASVVFGSLHAPRAIVSGASTAGVIGTVVFLSLSGIGFGVVYEATHNVYFVALLHAIGNTWVLVVDVWQWSGAAFWSALIGMAVLYVVATLAYRYWSRQTEPRSHRVNQSHA